MGVGAGVGVGVGVGAVTDRLCTNLRIFQAALSIPGTGKYCFAYTGRCVWYENTKGTYGGR